MRCLKLAVSTTLAASLVILLFLTCRCAAQQKRPATAAIPYLKLTTPRRVLPQAQAWEGKEFPHSLSVLELKRGGYRYWGWYGLNEGGGIGLARSNDLVNWTKYGQNPLLTNARWPSLLAHADPAHPSLLYVAFTRNYDTPTSHVVLGATPDGIHITEVKTLVQPVPNQRNQNPNLFRDPGNHRFYLTWYRGNDNDHFEIVSRNAASIADLDKAPDKVLLRSQETIAAPTLLYLKHARNSHGKKGVYYLATEIYPHRYTDNPEGEWQVKVFAADAPDGDFLPVQGDPVLRGQRACLFPHVFHGRFYGYDCHLQTPDHWILEEVEAPLP